MKDTRGFSLIELMIVVSIIGLLAGIAGPKLQQARYNARAAQIVGAMRAIRIGATIYNDSAGTWPPSAALGVVPSRLRGYLPNRGAALFSGAGWQLRWRVVNVSGGPAQAQLQARTSDRNLCAPLAKLLGGASAGLAVACNATPGRVTQTIER